MADNPHGFNPVKHKLGVPLSATVNPYYKKADYAVALFIGDPVVKNGTSKKNIKAVARVIRKYDLIILPF